MATDDAEASLIPDGEDFPLEDVDHTYEQALHHFKSHEQLVEYLLVRALKSGLLHKFPAAQAYFELALTTTDSDTVKAECILSIGRLMEQDENYEQAAVWYRKASDLPPGIDDTWYFLRNNLGYCLNRFGQHEEARELCQMATTIDPHRHNAHKNLGIALEGLGRYPEAADSYRRAAEVCPDDPRGLVLLQTLLAKHPEIE